MYVCMYVNLDRIPTIFSTCALFCRRM